MYTGCRKYRIVCEAVRRKDISDTGM
jgi:hypothetical protein